MGFGEAIYVLVEDIEEFFEKLVEEDNNSSLKLS